MNLFSFIKNLTPEEIKSISTVFKIKKAQISQGQEPGLENRFFNLVLNTPLDELNDNFIFSQLGEWESENAYQKFKSRVFMKILDRMVSDDFLGNEDIIESGDRAQVRLKKKLLQAQILFHKVSKSGPDVVLHLLNDIIEEAKEFEMYEVLQEALTGKKYIVSNRLGYKEFQKIQAEVDFYQACAQSRRAANDFYYLIITNQNLISDFSEKQMDEFIEQKIRSMESDPYTTVSTGIQYFYKIIRLSQAQRTGRISESVDLCLDLINLLNRSKAIRRRERFGFVYDYLSKCFVLQRNFKEAAQTTRAAQHYYPHESFAYMISKQSEFYACFYGKDYTRCREVLETLLSHNKRDAGEIRHDVFTYFSGCLDFAEGKYMEAKRISNLALAIMKDKPRWDLGVRYLKIMSMVELGEIAEATDAIESLRKQIKRNNPDSRKNISERDAIIYKTLVEYSLCGFGKTASSRLTYFLKRLSKKDTSYSWKFYSHELIPIQRWIQKRITSTLSERTGNFFQENTRSKPQG